MADVPIMRAARQIMDTIAEVTEHTPNTNTDPDLDAQWPRTAVHVRTSVDNLVAGDWFVDPDAEEYGEAALVGYVPEAGTFTWACTLGRFRTEPYIRVDLNADRIHRLETLAADLGKTVSTLEVKAYREVEAARCSARLILEPY